MTGQSAAIAGLTSCAASATVASKSFFIVPPLPETNGDHIHILQCRSFTVAARPQPPGICRALISGSRSALLVLDSRAYTLTWLPLGSSLGADLMFRDGQSVLVSSRFGPLLTQLLASACAEQGVM